MSNPIAPPFGFKKAEYSDGVVVRVFEYGGKAQQAQLGYQGQRYNFSLMPYEIKTLLLENGKLVEVNMIEGM